MKIYHFYKDRDVNQLEKLFSENRDATSFCRGYVGYLTSILENLDYDAVGKFIQTLLDVRESGRRILFLGNGGSSATSSHFANDLSAGTRDFHKPFKALNLTDNTAILTAIANDSGFEEVFKKQLQIYMEEGDIIVAISASGNSENLVRAIEYAKSMGNKTVGLLGFDGGKLLEICDEYILIETGKGEYGPVEDVHMMLDHMVVNYLYQYIRSQ